MSKLYQKLERIVSEKRISNNLYVRHAYSRNVSSNLQGVPDLVIRPNSTEEISEILKIANEENIPVIPRGGGDCEFGGSKPIGDTGIVLDTKSMNSILNLDEENLIVNVEAGISWGKLNEYLCHYGLYTGCLGPGSGMTSSIGGGISHHSVGGGGCAKYGACTNQLVSLEVVLPTGEIITTGSQANIYSKYPFNRFGNGPDLTSLFCGDNGIFGVKTIVSLQVFPKPEFASYKTFLMPRKSLEISAQIMSEIRQKGIAVYDTMYFMDLVVSLGIEYGMFPMWEHLKRKRGIIFYTIEAISEAELDSKVRQLDNIILNKKAEEFGSEISDGNIAKWHYEEQGHWLIAHNLWGLVPGFDPVDAECKVPINAYPKIMRDLDQWDLEHSEDMQEILRITGMRPVTGSGPIIMVKNNNVELTCGFSSFTSYYNGEKHIIIEEINIKLWKSLLKRLVKHGAMFYMQGDILSRLMADIGGYQKEYYELMKAIKKAIDPKHILSRGKYNFWGDDTDN
ncbi:MAG: FAD-binding oxidoreductase [Candidatus Lokiarchaeota archaeon]|nr:FAD-binding oxidoreductase [Candidatus Lokiarchaeota archaeon]